MLAGCGVWRMEEDQRINRQHEDQRPAAPSSSQQRPPPARRPPPPGVLWQCLARPSSGTYNFEALLSGIPGGSTSTPYSDYGVFE